MRTERDESESALKGGAERGWFYETLGDYHRRLPPNWVYTTTYERKTELIRSFLDRLSENARIVDLGCGEGIFVEHARSRGRNAVGVDLNYSSRVVVRGDILHVPFQDGSFDVGLALDILEHLSFRDQRRALDEAARVIVPGGFLFVTVPNLAHLSSRLRFLFRGALDRTDQPEEHIGERPLSEIRQLLTSHRFGVIREIGITATVPILYGRLFVRNPARFRGLQDRTEPLARIWPNAAKYVLLVCRRNDSISPTQ